MNAAVQYLIDVVFTLASIIFIARFLLQACRANFYNPVSQGIVKITDPVLKPARMVLPSIRNIDLASFAFAWLAIGLLMAIQYPATPIGLMIGYSAVQTLILILKFLYWSIFAVIILSFLSPGNPHPLIALLHEITEPVLAPARRIIPSFGGLDFSPMLVLLVLYMLELILVDLFQRLAGALV